MPGYTPNLALPYPLMSEVVDATAWQALSQAVDDALSAVDVIRQQNLHRATAWVQGSVLTIGPATTTTMLYSTNVWTVPSSLHSTSSNTDQFVIPTTGLYFMSALVSVGALATTLTSVTAGLTQNGTATYTASQSSGGTTAVTNIMVKGLFFCVAGDILRVTGRWTGTGTANFGSIAQIYQLANA